MADATSSFLNRPIRSLTEVTAERRAASAEQAKDILGAVNAYTSREREDAVREALEILREEGWLGRSEQRIAALANPISDRSATRR